MNLFKEKFIKKRTAAIKKAKRVWSFLLIMWSLKRRLKKRFGGVENKQNITVRDVIKVQTVLTSQRVQQLAR